jgi:hypothetical protein
MRRFRVLMSFVTGVLLSLATVLCAQTIPGPELDQIKTGDEALKAGYLLVSGLGVGGERPHRGQKEVMALRAAQILAYRELLESVQGITISSETTVQNAMADEKVRVAVEGVVRGAQTVSKHYDPQKDVATVYVRLPIKGSGSVMEMLLPHLKTVIPPSPESSMPYTPPPDAPSAPTPAPTPAPKAAVPSADGLIVDVTAHIFRPALINRILSEQGEILYDPSKIAQEILVERGSGDYTTDTGKAKAILSERGSSNPMTIRAKDVARRTDIQVSKEDAVAIFTANQQTNFLEGAKVVFVLK